VKSESRPYTQILAALHAAGAEWWSWNPATDAFVASRALRRMVGWTNGAGARLEDVAALIPGIERDRVIHKLRRTSADAEPFDAEVRIRDAAGGERALRVKARRVGRCVYGVAQPVTATGREHEREKRLASLGQLAASVAHEFNNVLMSILPFAELLKRRHRDDEKVVLATDHIFQAIRRGRQISQEIQRLARPVNSVSLIPIDIGRWVSDFAKEAKTTLGPTIAVQTEISDQADLTGRADLALLTQVATNIVVNAREAMPAGGDLTIRVVRAATGEIEIAFGDSGPGIPEHLVDHIFDPLFTTKPRGTGLGLSIAYQAMSQMGGSLRVTTREGEGATFTVVLPSASSPLLGSGDEPKAEVKKILLVEDDESVAEGLRALLQDEGFDVRLIATGTETVDAVRQFVPDLVLLDVNLPDISGLDVYEQLRDRWPSMRVILSTGHADARALGKLSGSVVTIMKPYDMSELLRTISAT